MGVRSGSSSGSLRHDGGDVVGLLRPRGGLHIVLVAPPYFQVPPTGYGGVEEVVAQLADALVARGHRVTLIGVGEPGTAADFVAVATHGAAEQLGEAFPEVVHALRVRQAIEELAATGPIDVVHDHTFAGVLNAPTYRRLGIPTVLTVHGAVDGEFGEYYRRIGASAGLVAISDRQRALAPGLNWVGRVHNAIVPQRWPLRTEKEPYALFLGRYSPCKGADLALRAAHEAGVPLILAAKCIEPIEKEFFEDCVRPLLGDRDVVFGEADSTQKRQLLAGARCLLFPIRWEEPFGMVMIEAMACGTPVVALRGGAVAEVVEHGVTGWVCETPAELPDAVRRSAALDPRECRARVERLFSVDRLAAGYEAVYRETVATAPLPASAPALVGSAVR